MRQLTAAAAVTAIGFLLAGCGGSNQGGSASSSSSASSSTTSATPSKPPLAPAALPNLLLTPAEIDTAMGVTGSKSGNTFDALRPDETPNMFSKGYKFPDECVYVTGPGRAPVYAGSANTAVRGEHDTASLPPPSNEPDPDVTQFVVSFASAEQASAFFSTASQRWPACANRQDTSPADADTPEIHWSVGAVSSVNGVLSTVTSITATKNGQTISESCQRALSVRNNIVIDVEGCRKDPGDLAVKVASQIAGKVDTQ
jgi:PknH-like extracellular domain